MLPINYLLKSLQKQPKEAHRVNLLHQPTALFRQEACGYSDAWDCYTVTAEADLIMYPPIFDRREPTVADIWDYANNSFLFNPEEN